MLKISNHFKISQISRFSRFQNFQDFKISQFSIFQYPQGQNLAQTQFPSPGTPPPRWRVPFIAPLFPLPLFGSELVERARFPRGFESRSIFGNPIRATLFGPPTPRDIHPKYEASLLPNEETCEVKRISYSHTVAHQSLRHEIYILR